MELQAPLTIFVDEAGSSHFCEPKLGQRKKAFAVCAVAVPTIAFAGLRSILPRSSAGEFIKSSHHEFTPARALTFVEHLIRSTADVGAAFVDPGRPENIKLASDLLRMANEGAEKAREQEATPEGKRLHPDLRQHDLPYLHFLGKALFACIEANTAREKRVPRFFDIVVDCRDDVCAIQRERFRRTLLQTCQESGLRIGQFAWKTEQDEPLLMLPDLFAGIVCREDRYRDVGAAATRIWDAEKAGRFVFKNKPPPEL